MSLFDDALKQLQAVQFDKNHVFQCCGEQFQSLYEFRRHIFDSHKDLYDSLFSDFHREVIDNSVPIHCPNSKKRRKKHKKSRGRKDTSLSPYKTNRPPISIPMGGMVKK